SSKSRQPSAWHERMYDCASRRLKASFALDWRSSAATDSDTRLTSPNSLRAPSLSPDCRRASPIPANASAQSGLSASAARNSFSAAPGRRCSKSRQPVARSWSGSGAVGGAMVALSSSTRWHFLYFLPEPQGHGSFRPVCAKRTRALSALSAFVSLSFACFAVTRPVYPLCVAPSTAKRGLSSARAKLADFPLKAGKYAFVDIRQANADAMAVLRHDLSPALKKRNAVVVQNGDVENRAQRCFVFDGNHETAQANVDERIVGEVADRERRETNAQLVSVDGKPRLHARSAVKRQVPHRRRASGLSIPALAGEVERNARGSPFALVAGHDALDTASAFLVELAKSNAHAGHRRLRDPNHLALALEQRQAIGKRQLEFAKRSHLSRVLRRQKHPRAADVDGLAIVKIEDALVPDFHLGRNPDTRGAGGLAGGQNAGRRHRKALGAARAHHGRRDRALVSAVLRVGHGQGPGPLRRVVGRVLAAFAEEEFVGLLKQELLSFSRGEIQAELVDDTFGKLDPHHPGLLRDLVVNPLP